MELKSALDTHAINKCIEIKVTKKLAKSPGTSL